VTENNGFVTVALLLISDCEEVEEEIFRRTEGIESEDRDFTENILLYCYIAIYVAIH